MSFHSYHSRFQLLHDMLNRLSYIKYIFGSRYFHKILVSIDLRKQFLTKMWFDKNYNHLHQVRNRLNIINDNFCNFYLDYQHINLYHIDQHIFKMRSILLNHKLNNCLCLAHCKFYNYHHILYIFLQLNLDKIHRHSYLHKFIILKMLENYSQGRKIDIGYWRNHNMFYRLNCKDHNYQYFNFNKIRLNKRLYKDCLIYNKIHYIQCIKSHLDQYIFCMTYDKIYIHLIKHLNNNYHHMY